MRGVLREDEEGRDEQVAVEYLADLRVSEARALIGKQIARVVGREHELILVFTDGSQLECHGATWDGCSLGLCFYDVDERQPPPYEFQPQPLGKSGSEDGLNP